MGACARLEADEETRRAGLIVKGSTGVPPAPSAGPVGRLLVAAGFLQFSAWYSVAPLIPIFAREVAGLEDTGPLLSVYGISAVLSCLPVRWLAQSRVRHLALVGTGALSLTHVVVMAARSIYGWVLVLALGGLAQVYGILGCQALIALLFPGDLFQRQVSKYFLATTVGSLAGPVLGASACELGGRHWVSLAGLVLALASGIVLVGVERRLPKLTGAVTPSARLVNGSKVGWGVIAVPLGMSFLGSFSNAVRTTFLPLFLAERGAGVGTVGAVLSAQSLFSILGMVVVASGFFPGRRRRIAVCAALTIGGGLLIAGSMVHSWRRSVGCIILCGLPFGLVFPTTAALTVRLAGGHSIRALGVRLLLNHLAVFLAPIVYGAAAAEVGLSAAVASAGLTLLIGAVIAVGISSGADAQPGKGAKGGGPQASGSRLQPTDGAYQTHWWLACGLSRGENADCCRSKPGSLR